MKKHDIDEKVKKAFTSDVPNVLDNIIFECRKQEKEVVVMPEIKEKKKMRFMPGLVGAFAVLVIGIFIGVLYQKNYTVDSIISLDVNPSIEIKTNQKEMVLEVNALNEDGKVVVEGYDFKNSSIDDTINTLINSMIKNGYLSDDANSILVSVYNDNQDYRNKMQARLSNEIDSIFRKDKFSGALLCQGVTHDEKLQSLADKYDISLGKARLIQDIIKKAPQLSYEELTKLSINELNVIRRTNNLSLDDVDSIGDASDLAYIGIDKAKAIAFEKAKVSDEKQVSDLEIEMDCEHRVMIYEVSFDYQNQEYDYEIDAKSGEIINSDIRENDDNQNNVNKKKISISADQAKDIALNHAKISDMSKVKKVEIELDDNLIYEISFHYQGKEYDYDIDAISGKIINNKVEPVDDKNNVNKNKVNINKAKAKEIALNHAKISDKRQVRKMEIELDDNKVYEISFDYQNQEYDYSIDAKSGKIINYKVTPNDNDDQVSSDKNKNQTSINKAKAKEIALNHAKISDKSQVRNLEIELDDDMVYEISFEYQNYEYDYEINAKTGEIIKAEKDDD